MYDQPEDQLATLGSVSTLSSFSGDFVLVLRKLYANLYPAQSRELLDGTIPIPTMYRYNNSLLKTSGNCLFFPVQVTQTSKDGIEKQFGTLY